MFIKPKLFNLRLRCRALYEDTTCSWNWSDTALYAISKISKKSNSMLDQKQVTRGRKKIQDTQNMVFLRWKINWTGSTRQFSRVTFFYGMNWMVRFLDMSNNHNLEILVFCREEKKQAYRENESTASGV